MAAFLTEQVRGEIQAAVRIYLVIVERFMALYQDDAAVSGHTVDLVLGHQLALGSRVAVLHRAVIASKHANSLAVMHRRLLGLDRLCPQGV